MTNGGYGVVYTPDALSDFVATLLVKEFGADHGFADENNLILDPACGEGALLCAVKKAINNYYPTCKTASYIGVDVDATAIETDKQNKRYSSQSFYCFDAILPDVHDDPIEFWHKAGIYPSLIIANPPWSSEKIYNKDRLSNAGYHFDVGQYDSYILFIDLCLRLIVSDGMLALIIPDSIFSGENRNIRKHLAENTQLRVIARLGEKLFSGVNRATTVLIIKNSMPNSNSTTKCFRLTTEQRKSFFAGTQSLLSSYNSTYFCVKQNRFCKSPSYIFDIDTREYEEELLAKLEANSINWNNIFHFGRGVEISKTGMVTVCPCCNTAQGYSKKQYTLGEKTCTRCKSKIKLSEDTVSCIIASKPAIGYTKIYVGENVHRYSLSGANFIKMNMPGINYKEAKLYEPPKILIRKTGLGINACLDYEGTYISQTVYSCNYLQPNSNMPLEYYLGILNSRIIYYYYLKRYGENEWKSHPYVTKEIIFSLPIKAVTIANHSLCTRIATLAKALQKKYSREDDLLLDSLIAKLYDITEEELQLISAEINRLPDLSAINYMKFNNGDLCLDI